MKNTFDTARIVGTIAGIFGLVMVAGLLMKFVFNKEQKPLSQHTKEARKYVETQKVAYDAVKTELTLFGRVASAQPLDVVAEVQGKITEVSVPLKEGQKFSRGAILFRVDDTEAKLNLQAQKSTFLKDIATILPDFKIDFQSSYPAWQSYFDNIDVNKPLPDLPAITSNKEKTFLATKNILTSFYNIKSREANLTKYVVKAPFSGTITQVITQSGSVVNPGTKVANVVRTNKLELKVPVETNDIRWVKRGTKVAVSTEDEQLTWNGTISRIGDVVNPNTQALDVFITIQPNKNKVYDGMYLKSIIPAGKVENVLEVPRNIVYNNKEVFVVEQDSLLKVKEVKIHKVNAETMLISGLPEGSDLVMETLVNAHNDMRAFRLSDAEKHRKEDLAKQQKAKKEGEKVKENDEKAIKTANSQDDKDTKTEEKEAKKAS